LSQTDSAIVEISERDAPLAQTPPPSNEPLQIGDLNAPSAALPMNSPNPLPEPEQASTPATDVVAAASNSQTAPHARTDATRNEGAKTTGAKGQASSVAAKTPLQGKAARDQAGQRALAAANQALADGRLTSPPEENAYTLYNKVLAIDPGSAKA